MARMAQKHCRPFQQLVLHRKCLASACFSIGPVRNETEKDISSNPWFLISMEFGMGYFSRRSMVDFMLAIFVTHQPSLDEISNLANFVAIPVVRKNQAPFAYSSGDDR